MRYCCLNCFERRWHKELGEYVSRASQRVECPFCGALSIRLINLVDLYEPLSTFLSQYSPVSHETIHYGIEDPWKVGARLVYLVQEDWGLFSDRVENAGELLETIANYCWDHDSGESQVDAFELYTHRPSKWHTPMALEWAEMRQALREDPDGGGPESWSFWDVFCEELSRYERDLPKGTRLYRARRGYPSDPSDPLPKIVPWEGEDIHAPRHAPEGRANRKGHRVLYCADQEHTAIGEVRPARGNIVSVCELRIQRTCRIIDTCRRLPQVNPFRRDNYDLGPRYTMEVHQCLRELAADLSKPLLRSDDPTEYVPTQRVCKALESLGWFDGIRYFSSMVSKGTNVVFFDPSVALIKPSWLVQVLRLDVDYERFDEEELHEDELRDAQWF